MRQRDLTKPVPAIVLSTHNTGLGVIRALGENGIPVIAVYYQRQDMGYVSRYVRHKAAAPHPEDEEGFISLLVDLSRAYGRGLLLPCDDATLVAAARNKPLLSRYHVVACPDWPAVETAVDKSRTYALAESIGIAVPKTTIPAGRRDVEIYGAAAEYPLLVKPRQSHRYFEKFKKKMVKVADIDQLMEAYEQADSAGLKVMLQEYIPGPDSDGINYNSYFRRNKPMAEFTARKVRLSPPDSGVPSVVVSRRVDEVLPPGRKLLGALGYEGYSCMEFKKDRRDGTYKLMEINARHNRSTLLAVRCGINFPLMEYRHLTAGESVSANAYTEGLHWIDCVKDLAAIPGYRGRNGFSIGKYASPYLGRHTFAVLSLKDPLPSVKRCADIIGMIAAKAAGGLWGKRPPRRPGSGISPAAKLIAVLLVLLLGRAAIGGTGTIKGMNYTAWDQFVLNSPQSDASLSNARRTGCNWMSICVWWFQDNPNSTIISPDYSRYSADPDSVANAIDRCRALGMKVMLKPIVNCRDGTWNGHINPSTAWFASYRNFINFWADFAEAHNVELFCAGAELVQTISWSAQWRTVIRDARNRYSGPLVYSANYDNERHIDWWDELEYIGIDPYYPLTDVNDPTESQLQDAWRGRADDLEAWLYANWPDKKIIFSEIGYQSCDGTNQTPWRREPAQYGLDLQEQADCYKALLDQLKGRPWWLGVFWWNWETDPEAGGAEDRWHSPQNKPAETLLSSYYAYCGGFTRGDVNRDLLVDMSDLEILSGHWLTGRASCDIWPVPGGDSAVNFLDFAVLAANRSDGPKGDINGDGAVNMEDLGMIAARWLWTGDCGGIAEDIFEDGIVNLQDFAVFAGQW
jgi:predicted ATP-grasp superfamily ATP-dependent carboligase